MYSVDCRVVNLTNTGQAQALFVPTIQGFRKNLPVVNCTQQPCPCCDVESLPCSVLDHVLAEHNVYTASSGDEVIEQLRDLNFQPLADFISFCVSCMRT